MQNTFGKKLISLLLCAALVLSYIPATALHAKAADVTIVEDSKKADPSTLDGWTAYFGQSKPDTEFAGAVWTDKSVFAANTAALPGATLTDSDNFLVALSAIASDLSVTGHTATPTDTMLVLDLSGSMVDGTYEVGTIRNGNRYQTVSGIDMSLISAMVEATNDAIDTLMKQNTNNRVGVVLYSGNTSTNQAATASTATVVLPLGRYTGVSGEYLSIDTTWQEAALYEYNNWRWQATGETATYVATGTNVSVSVKDGLKTETGGSVTDNAKRANGGTYIQNGLYHAMNQFLAVTDTIVPAGKPQAGAQRLPVLVLMSDGAPTIATTNYTSIGNSDTGNGSSTSDRITFLTQLTAAYVRGKVAAHYQKQDILLLTLGLGTENSAEATNTLYPAGSNQTLQGYWNTYLQTAAGSSATIISGNNGLSVTRDAAVAAMNYVDKYFYATDADGLIASFAQILGEIELNAASYATLVEGSSADLSGYVTFEDELGEMMQVYGIKGILMDDGNGNSVLYTGKGIAESLTEGNLGTVSSPNERGDELVRTVRERIPGLTTTQAQQLIGYAYNDRQLYFENDSSWSNYIGWYADANGNYVGFWDKDSGYENAPTGAVYANRSYGYLGVNGNSDMMHVVVMVRTELATLHQTVNFKIPASLLPTVRYNVSLEEDSPDRVETFTCVEAIPMRLVFEVGLRSGINSVNLNDKIAEHIARGGHVHRNSDGTVTFYTNEWAIGNDTNGNGVPDKTEIETALVAESHFHPALDNNRFYYTSDAVVLDANGDPVTNASRPSGSGYYYNRYYYSAAGRQTKLTPIAPVTLETDATYADGRWYIPEGTMYHALDRFRVDKMGTPTGNLTGTLGYAFYPVAFDSGTKQDVYAFLGNNGSFTVAPAQGIALTKTVSQVNNKDGAPTTFTFSVELSQPVANPVITDTDGNPLAGIWSVSNNVITVELTAGQTVLITGIPTGTTYTVTEAVTEYYTASSVNATGTVSANTVHAVDFVNTAKHYGALVVSKDVNYPEGFAPGTAHNDKNFTVTVTFTGDITGIVAPQGATQSGNAFTLTLKDGQSATFANIPAGVTYTVSESNIPAGYALDEIRYSDNANRIDGNDMDQAHVVNSYSLASVTPNIKVHGSKTLVTNDTTWGGEEFLVELLEAENPADQDPVSTGMTATLTESSPNYEFDLSHLSPFTKPGTYYYRVVEQIPANRNSNIAYDRTFGQFSVVVGDSNADGALEVQSVTAYQSTAVTGDADNGWAVTKNFTNVVTTDRVYLNIQKRVIDADTQAVLDVHRGNLTFGLYTAMTAGEPAYYATTDHLGSATVMIPVTKASLQAAGTDGVTYYMREIAPAAADRIVGMHYNESWIYAVNIKWNDTENKADVTYATIENDVVGTYSAYDESAVTFTHTNTYEQNVSTGITLTGKKTVNGGNELGGRTFSFSLYRSTAAFVYDENDPIATVHNSGNEIAFRDIPFTAPGVYYLVAKENASNYGGITDDTTEYHITVEVEKFTDTDGTTRLRVVSGYPTVVAYGTSANVGADGLNWNNSYTVTGQGSVTFGGEKLLSGRALVAGEFAIGLYRDSACTDLVESVTNNADGTFQFSTRIYTPADLGENLATKTYTYYVKEIPGDKGGVSYDTNTYTVTVEVSHQDGVLKVTPSANATDLEITNTYKANGVAAVIKGSKVLSGDWTYVANKDFTFQLYKADASFAITDAVAYKTATVTGSADFTITLNYEDGEEGIYYFVLKEDTSANAGGVSYDAGEYHITVNVSDPGNGQLAATVTMYRPGTGNTETAVFTNGYAAAATTATLAGVKHYTNSVSGDALEMEEGMFDFVVLENGAPVSTGYNLADGTLVFEPITYTQAGVHTYTVAEVKGETANVTYDDTVFTVTVTVTDNGEGVLTAEVNYGQTPVVFENTYTTPVVPGPEPEPEPKPEPQPEPKPEPKPEPQPEPQPEPRPETKPTTPQTGDFVSPAVLVFVCLLSVTCLFVLLLSKKHETQ